MKLIISYLSRLLTLLRMAISHLEFNALTNLKCL